jgi:hypothetical protein
MTEQEWREYYDQACVSAGKITAPETRIAVHVILQMLTHLHGKVTQPGPEENQAHG